MSKTRITTTAAANIALIKYWGKRDGPGNQPATPSLSIGLEDLRTTTLIQASGTPDDIIEFEGTEKSQQRIKHYIDQVRLRFDAKQKLHIVTRNNFPTGTGLASSASGFAALAIGINEFLNLGLSVREVSSLAMSGSGSAARSVSGGYMEVFTDESSHADQILEAEQWPLSVFVAVTETSEKTIGSTEAMKLTARTSPYYNEWLTTHNSDMEDARTAILAQDFEKLASISEHNCLKMHAAIMTSHPPIIYWNPATLAVMQRTIDLRNSSIPAFFTIDAGSQVKVICPPEYKSQVSEALKDLQGIHQLIETHVGGDPVIQWS